MDSSSVASICNHAGSSHHGNFTSTNGKMRPVRVASHDVMDPNHHSDDDVTMSHNGVNVNMNILSTPSKATCTSVVDELLAEVETPDTSFGIHTEMIPQDATTTNVVEVNQISTAAATNCMNSNVPPQAPLEGLLDSTVDRIR